MKGMQISMNSCERHYFKNTKKSRCILESVFKLVYVQQKEFDKALFKKRKAIYKRNPESLTNIVNLGQLAIEDGNEEAAKEILGFVLQNTQDLELLIQANSYWLL
jgi:hypothetical protein